FSKWTSGGHMRHPIFAGMRSDKPPEKISRERPVDNKAAPRTDRPDTRVKLTHLDKVFWPEAGYTKRDLLDYYMNVRDFILPYLKDRPESLLRQPDGYSGKAFFQKD